MPGRNFTDAEEEQIAKIYLAGHSAKSIARAYGLNHHISIVSALKRQGVKMRSVSERNRIYPFNIHAFDDLSNEQAAYWFGFLYADGSIYRNTIRLCLKETDASHVKAFRAFLESNAPIFIDAKRSSPYNTKRQNCIEVSDVHTARRLQGLGLVVGRTCPEHTIDNVPDCSVHHWIRGFFDGDGSARKSQSISLCGDPIILAWIRKIAANTAGTNPNLAISKHKTANVHYLYFTGRLHSLKFADFIYQDATIWLGHKRDVINTWSQP